MICWNCYHFTNRRGLFGLCYQPEKHLAGLRSYAHAPYRCAICPACSRFEPLNNNAAQRLRVTVSALRRGFDHRRAATVPGNKPQRHGGRHYAGKPEPQRRAEKGG